VLGRDEREAACAGGVWFDSDGDMDSASLAAGVYVAALLWVMGTQAGVIEIENELEVLCRWE
jgi:hypothetical protein